MKNTKVAEKIILCTTKRKDDDILCEIAKNKNIDYFRGSEEDKLMRWYGACKYHNIENFVNVDGDDIFFDSGGAGDRFRSIGAAEIPLGIDFQLWSSIENHYLS